MKFVSRLLVAALLLLAAPAWPAITFFGTGASPADNVAQSDTTDITVTPPASMTAGDLIYCVVSHRATVTLTNVVTGGQTWNAETAQQASTMTLRIFWAVFNGTWDANPTFHSTVAQTSAFSAICQVFRPTSTTHTWATDVAQQASSFAAPGSPADVTRTGQTVVTAASVTIATFASSSANTWTLQTGGWTNPGGQAQWRNTRGASTSISQAYVLNAATGATGNVVNRQNSSTAGQTFIKTLREVAQTTPTFTVAPNITATSATGYTVAFTPSESATAFFGALAHGSAAPTCDQLEANTATGGIEYETKSVTGADSVTFASLDFPTQDIYGCLEVGATDSAVASILDAFKAPPTGRLYDDLASIGVGSYCEPIATPAVAAGDIVEIDSATTSSAFAITTYGTCHLSYGGDDSRQRLCYRIYDDSAKDWMAGTGSPLCSGTRFALWFNNQAPVFAPSQGTLTLDTDSAMTAVDLCAQAIDAEGDALTAAITAGTLPTGLSLSGTGNCSLGGTPTVENESGINVTVTVTDIAGATADYQLTIFPLDTITVPDCVGETLGNCIDALQAVFLDAGVISFSYSISIPAGTVISQSPAAATEQEEGTAIDLVLSRGQPGGRNRLRLNLGLH